MPSTIATAGAAAVPMQAKKNSFYRPELDCLRFFAFFVVFLHHSIPKTPDFFLAHHLPAWLSNIGQAGAYGVDLFFCLSAYLITELLLREKDQVGHLNVKAFYIRRMLRIWPLYFSFVLFAFALTLVDRSQHFSVIQLIMFLFLAGNWAPGLTVMQSIVVPLWSVSIEEQFYLLWPLAVRKATRKQMFAICIVLVGVAFMWRALLHIYKPALIWNSTFSHLDSIAYGILLSLVGFRKEIALWSRLLLLLSGLLAWFLAGGIHNRDDIAQVFAALGSIAILRAVVGMKLDQPILVRLGVVSYGLYVYHLFFLTYLNKVLPTTHGLGFVLWWVLSFSCTVITALLSYRWLESPFLKLKERFTVVNSRPV